MKDGPRNIAARVNDTWPNLTMPLPYACEHILLPRFQNEYKIPTLIALESPFNV